MNFNSSGHVVVFRIALVASVATVHLVISNLDHRF